MWHKGIAWPLCTVGEENFWGGPSWLRGHGYQQLPNDGTMRHEGFGRLEMRDGVLHLEERLGWLTQQSLNERGEAAAPWIAETRRMAVDVLPDAGAWRLSFGSEMRNMSGAGIPFG